MFKEYTRDELRLEFPEFSFTTGLSEAARKKFMDPKSFHRVFRNYITDNIESSMFKDFYTANTGAGCQNPVVLMAMLIYKEFKGLTDAELEHMTQFDPCAKFAIGFNDNSQKMPCLKTYTNFVGNMRKYDEAREEGSPLFIDGVFESINAKLAKEFGVDGFDVRMDSSLFGTNIAYCHRYRIVCDALRNFAKGEDFTKIESQELRERIRNAVSVNPERAVYDTPPAVVGKSMLEVGKLMSEVISIMGEEVDPDFKRVFCNQYVTSEAAGGKTVVAVKPGKDISPDSVQNVNDPDAGYRKKYEPQRGLCVQCAESFSEDREKLNLITGCIVTPINRQDSDSYIPLLQQSKNVTGNLARKSYQDGGYWSIENVAFGDGRITPCFTALTGAVPTHAFTRGADGNPVVTCVATGEVVPLIPVNIRDKSGEAKFKYQYGTNNGGKPKYRTMTVAEIENAIVRESYRHSPGSEKKRRNNVEATVSSIVSELDGDKTKYRGIWRNQLYFSCRCIGINARRIELHVSNKSRKGKRQVAA